ncbi:MAG TPA: hypothetical protein VFB21_16270 [Chthonomonadaceae bacterium]|nr:hypothetical protein [Chthonomonadaceae bacterium]
MNATQPTNLLHKRPANHRVRRLRKPLQHRRPGKYPHTDAGVEVRRIFHKLRSVATGNFNEQFKGIFSAHEQAPTKGQVATKRFALGANFLYPLALLYRWEQGLRLRIGLKAFLRVRAA